MKQCQSSSTSYSPCLHHSQTQPFRLYMRWCRARPRSCILECSRKFRSSYRTFPHQRHGRLRRGIQPLNSCSAMWPFPAAGSTSLHIFNKYNSKCSIIYVFRFVLEQLHVVHINVFLRIQYIRLLLFYSVIFQSCKFQSLLITIATSLRLLQ